MFDRKQYNLAVAGLVLTLCGLLALLVVPVAIGVRLQRELDRIRILEDAREEINEVLQAALYSDTFLMHRFTVPGETNSARNATAEYAYLLSKWRPAVKNDPAVVEVSPVVAAQWHSATLTLSRWIDVYLAQYQNGAIIGNSMEMEQEEKAFDKGVQDLYKARDSVTIEERNLRDSQQWLHSAQMNVVTPMAIICFSLAFVAWMNLRTLQQTWMREREISAHLEVAVQESNHRIKNNLQVIGALVDMQIQEPGDTVSKAALQDIVHQVKAVAAVHDFFSHELRSDQIQCDRMLRRLVDLTAGPIGLQVHLETEAIALAVKQATAVALITNELLLNSGKHGATEARVGMMATGSVARLWVSDNGPGFPAEFDMVQNSNLGLTLVDTLARHDLNGSLVVANDHGARVEIIFPLVAPA